MRKIFNSCIILAYKSGDILEGLWEFWGNVPERCQYQQFCKVVPSPAGWLIRLGNRWWVRSRVLVYLSGSNWYNAILVQEGCQSGRLGRSRKPLWAFGPPWVRIPPPPLLLPYRGGIIKKPDNRDRQVFSFPKYGSDQDDLSLVLLIRKMNPIASNPPPIKRMIKDCKTRGLKIGLRTLTLASINS